MREAILIVADYHTPHTVLVRDPEALIRSNAHAISEARDIGFRSTPDPVALIAEWRHLISILHSHSIESIDLKNSSGLTLDSLYVRDALVLTPDGLVKCRATKRNREAEPIKITSELESLGIAPISEISPPGRLEGGDVIWLADNVCAVGITYRTNTAGAAQL